MKEPEQSGVQEGRERVQKEIWKQILYKITDSQLLQLTNQLGIMVPGFRRLELKQISKLRTRIIAELMRPRVFHKVKREFQHMCREANPPELQLTRDEIWSRKDEPEFLAVVIPILMSSGDEEKEQLAEELCLLGHSAEQPQADEKLKIKELQAIIQQLEEKNKKQQNKLSEQQRCSGQTAKKQKQYEEELKRYERQNQILERQMLQVKTEKEQLEQQLKKQGERLQAIEQKCKSYENSLEMKHKEMEQQQKEISRLQGLCMTLSQTGRETAAAVTVAEPGIAIIGDIDAHNRWLEQCRVFSPEHAEPGDWIQYQFICLLRFAMKPASIRKVKKAVPKERIKEFADLYKLEQFVKGEGLG